MSTKDTKIVGKSVFGRRKYFNYLKEKTESFYEIYGKEYFVSIPWLVRTFREKRIKRNYDVYIGLTGVEGVGKSTLAFWITYFQDKYFARRVDKKLPSEEEVEELLKKYDYLHKIPPSDDVLQKIYNVFYPNFVLTDNPQKKITQISEVKTHGVVWDDEAIHTMYKLDWASKGQQSLTKEAVTNRKDFKFHIDCMPRFTDFTKSMRDGRIRYWIHVFDRGLANIKIPDVNEYNYGDPWHLKEHYDLLNKIKGKKLGEVSINTYIKLFKKSNFLIPIFIYFPQMPEHVEKCYTIISHFMKRNLKDKDFIEDSKSTSQKKWRKRFVRAIYYLDYLLKNYNPDMKLTKKDVAKNLGLSYQVYNSYLDEGDKLFAFIDIRNNKKLLVSREEGLNEEVLNEDDKNSGEQD